MKRVYENLSEGIAGCSEKERDKAERLRFRAQMLDEKDRLLIRMYLDNGASIRQLAKLTGQSEARLSRRINNLIERLNSDAYIRCLQHTDKIEQFEMEFARAYFLRGLSMREIADENGCSYHSVRKAISRIKWLIGE
jgi:predicted DNA-binding protein YlxM (UPF0122 family)